MLKLCVRHIWLRKEKKILIGLSFDVFLQVILDDMHQLEQKHCEKFVKA